MSIPAKALIVIPTYWTFEEGKPSPEKVSYDHPTPLSNKGTLPRLLESLAVLETPSFGVLVITATTDPGLETAAEEKVESIIAPFKDRLSVAQFAGTDLQLLQKSLGRRRFTMGTLSLQGYGNVRNLQLLVAQMLGVPVVIGLDDDEVVTDREFLRKALEFVGRRYGGEFVGGVGGFYLNETGEKLPPKEKENEREGSSLFARKVEIMKAALEELERKPGRLVETNFVYGGNMVIHRELFSQVPFDPYIPRGEDIDYVINARLAGYRFFFDKELSVVHLPPPTRNQLREDVVRFIYEREKLNMAGEVPGLSSLSPEALDPYPGAFLRDELEKEALAALREQGFSAEVVKYAKRYAREMVPRFFDFWREWPRLIQAVGEDRVLRKYMVQKMDFK